MTFNKCPGSDSRFLKMETRNCPKCGYKAEIFSDELKVRCPQCRSWIERQRLPSCVDWCKAARECVGEARWQRMKGKTKNRPNGRKEEK